MAKATSIVVSKKIKKSNSTKSLALKIISTKINKSLNSANNSAEKKSKHVSFVNSPKKSLAVHTVVGVVKKEHKSEAPKGILKKNCPNSPLKVHNSFEIKGDKLYGNVAESGIGKRNAHGKKKQKIARSNYRENKVLYRPDTQKKFQKDSFLKSKTTLKIKKSTKEILSKMSKKERKEFIRKLTAFKKPDYQMVRDAKLLWEKIRDGSSKDSEREACVVKLLNLVRGKLNKIVYKHDTCRVVQCLLTLKRQDIRDIIFDELTPEIIKMAKDKYGNFFVSKMLKYGSRRQKDIVINSFFGHCTSIFRFLCGAKILDLAYNDYANAEQRNRIVSEFYGKEFILFANEVLNHELKINYIAENNPEKIPLIMAQLEEVLNKAVQRIPNLKRSLLHKLLLDFLTYCSVDQKRGVVDQLKDQLPEICHTREGSKAAMICVWYANNQQREAIVESLSGLTMNSCKDEFSRRLLFAIFDSVDNTQIINDVITKPIADNIADVIYNKMGVWVLHYLVHPRDFRVFGKGLCEILKEGDANEFTKRNADERYKELFECLRNALLTFMAANMREVITNKVSAVLVVDTLEPSGDNCPFFREISIEQKTACFKAIAEIAGDEFIPHQKVEGVPHIIERGAARFVFRKLLQSDPNQSDVKLSDFVGDLPSEQLASFTATDPGCFALLEMAKSGSPKARKAVKAAVGLKKLQSSFLVGAKALHKELYG